MQPKSPCSYIHATQAAGFTWPSFLNSLAPGTTITISGVPAYNDAWSQANNCPTGGIVASAVTLGSAPASPTPGPSSAPVASVLVAIDAGGGASGTWAADTDFTGGLAAPTNNTINISRVTNPAPASVYQSNRFGKALTYTVHGLTPAAAYTVRLHFAETWWTSAGKRIFSGTINGATAFTNFDIFAAAGGKNIAIANSYATTADATGTITIALRATVDNALVSGVEIDGATLGTAPSPSPSPSPVPTAVPTSSGGVVNYPAPFPQWQNAVALKTVIDPVKAAAHIKSYDAAAMNLYANWNPGYSAVSGGVPGWYFQTNYAITSGPGVGFYVASNSDPTYTVYCDTGGYCGNSTGITGVHIPQGARTQNSGQGNCDCHLYLLEPVGWTPGSTNGTQWPTLPAPYQYEIDIEDASTSNGCAPASSTGCTTFNGGGTVYGWGIAAFSTGSTGWYGGQSSLNNGFSPGSAALSGWGGSADHSNTPFTSLVVTAQDVLQGAINHETGMALVCSESPQSDNWPASISGTDYPCSNLGSGDRGWSYGDHVWLNRTPAQIAADVASHTLTPMQGILATSFSQYGAIIFDNAGNWGPTFQLNTTSGDPAWSQVGSKYGLPTTSQNIGGVNTTGVLINLSLPMSYMKAYMHAIDSCVIAKTC